MASPLTLTPLGDAEDITRPGAFQEAATDIKSGAVRIFGSEDGPFESSVDGGLEEPKVIKPTDRLPNGNDNSPLDFEDGASILDSISEAGADLTRTFIDVGTKTFETVSDTLEATIEAPGKVIDTLETTSRVMVAIGVLALLYVATKK